MGTHKRTGMKVVGLTALVLLIGGMLAGGMAYPGRAPTVGPDGRRPLLFLGNEALPPLNFMKNGRPAGIVIDIAGAMAQRMPHPVEIRLMDWALAQQLVLDGRADALLQINANPERLALFEFSDPLLTSEFTIFTSTERQGIASLSDLHGLRVGVEKKGLPIMLLQEDPRIMVKIIPDFVQGFKMLAAGAVDAVVADRWVGSYVLAENRIRGVKLVEEPIRRSQSAIAVKKGNTNLLAEINAALADIRRDGTYDQIVNSWRSQEVVFETRERLRYKAWLMGVITVALIGALMGVAVLVREIRRRQRIEAALQLNEERLRFALETSHTGAWDFDLIHGTTFRSWEHDRIFGYTEPLPQWTYATFLEHVLPEDRDEVDRKMREAMHTQGPWDFECRIRRIDGEIRWIWVAGRLHSVTAGGMQRMAGIIQDITARKQAEQELARIVDELRNSLNEIKTLRGIVPICAHCKKIRDDAGFWSQVEAYVAKHTEATFSHGICPECMRKFFPDFCHDKDDDSSK